MIERKALMTLNSISPLKKRLLLGLHALSKINGGNYNSIFQLHKITKVPLAKINTLLNELHLEGAITLHSDNPDLNEAA